MSLNQTTSFDYDKAVLSKFRHNIGPTQSSNYHQNNEGWNPNTEGHFLDLPSPQTPKPSTHTIKVFNVEDLPSNSIPGHEYQHLSFDEFNDATPQNLGTPLKRPAEVDIELLEETLDPLLPDKDDINSNPQSIDRLSNHQSLDRLDVFFTIVEHPLKHQVKVFNILPAGSIQLMRHYQPTPSDYIVVKLVCDPKMEKDDIFLTAVSTYYSQNSVGEIVIQSLKVSQKMLPGRTKGYVFRLLYELNVRNQIVQSLISDEFFIWSNVNQKGYPRKERETFITHRIETNKKDRPKKENKIHTCKK